MELKCSKKKKKKKKKKDARIQELKPKNLKKKHISG